MVYPHSLIQSSPYEAPIMALLEIDMFFWTPISSPKPFLSHIPSLMLHPAGSLPEKCFTTFQFKTRFKCISLQLLNHKQFSFILKNRRVFSQHCSKCPCLSCENQNPAGAVSSGECCELSRSNTGGAGTVLRNVNATHFMYQILAASLLVLHVGSSPMRI